MLSDQSFLIYILYPLAGFVVGLFSSFSGLGGTFIMVPLLANAFGLAYNTAICCTLANMAGMALSGLVRHYQLGHIDIKLAIKFIFGSIPGAVLGRSLLRWLTDTYGMQGDLGLTFHIFYTALFAIGFSGLLIRFVRFIRRGPSPRAIKEKERLRGRTSRVLVVFTGGLAAGFLSGLLAIGGGIVTVPVLALLLGVPIQCAVGTSVFQMIPMATAATIVSIGTEDLDWAIILLLLVGSIPGARVGPLLLNRAVARLGRSD